MKVTAKTIVALILFLSAGAIAQKASGAGKATPVTAYKLVGLKVTGTQRYTEREILPASGLALGQNAGDADFKEAVRRLGETGLFTDVVYSYSFSPAGTKLELQLTDIAQDKLIPAHFDNFVWFTDAELFQELQRRVPLFKEDIPLAGSFPDNIEQALQTLLDEKQIPARVDYLREGTPGTDVVTGLGYRVTEIGIHIRNLEFPGASPDDVALLRTAGRRIPGGDYSRASLAVVAKFDFLPVYLRRGYLKASFAPSDAHVISQANGEVEVDAIVPVTPGNVYSTSVAEWKGNSVLTADALKELIHLPVGQPADAVRLVVDLEKVEKLYHTRGYMNAHVAPKPILDDGKSAVRYELNVSEGDQFKMGELEIIGLDSQAKTSLETAWKLHEGEPYNSEYPKAFLDETSRLLPRGLAWNAAVHEAVNDKDKTVDVTLRFTPK